MILFNEKLEKKIFFILLLFPTLINSQIIGSRKLNEINLLFLKVDFSAKYTKAEITHRNGTKEIGYIYGFIQNKALSFNFKNAFSSNPIDALNLSDKSFSFKKELDQKEINLTSDEIIEVKIIEDGVNFGHYKLMDLATVNLDGTIKDLKRKPGYHSIHKISSMFSPMTYMKKQKEQTVIHLGILKKLQL